jgi:hypothetical protein
MIEYINDSSGYQPGVCNIGPAEIRRRRQVGWAGVIATVGLSVALLLLDAPAITRMIIALPAAAAISGFLQAHLRFCAGFASAGLQNLGELGEQQPIEDVEARSADRRKALQVYAAAMLGGFAIAMMFTLLPL